MVRCLLCLRREETRITGPLSTKDEVTAHQNCLLYASGICCEDSPQFDDLFGFSAEDVLKEAKRGNKLMCSYCKRRGATAGCEVKRCKKSYHYPCAIHAEATPVEDKENEKYSLYCSKHHQCSDENGRPVNGRDSYSTKPNTSKDPSGAGPSKRPNSVDSATAGPSGYSSDSNSSSSIKRRTSKRRLSFSDYESEKNPPKHKAVGHSVIITDDSSDSDRNECETGMSIFAPIESETEASANSQLNRKDSEGPSSLTSGNQAHRVPQHGNGNEDDSDAGSASLLSPVRNRAESPPAASTAHPEVILITNGEVSGPEQSSVLNAEAGPSGLHPNSSTSDPEPSIDTASFWRNCNVAGCTQAVFTDFINDMNNLCSRIQSYEASQEDYDLAHAVMKSSGKLEGLLIKQQKELQKKQKELQKATAAMQQLMSALK